MLKQGVGYPQVAFGIFKINGVHLVGHSGGAYLTSLNGLAKIPQRDVLPHVAGEIDEDSIESLQPIAGGGQMIIMLNLSSWVATVQTQAGIHKRIGKRLPIDSGYATWWALKLPVAPPNLAP